MKNTATLSKHIALYKRQTEKKKTHKCTKKKEYLLAATAKH